MKIIISKHAQARFVERFRLHYAGEWFRDKRVLELMRRLFQRSHRDIAFDQVPFYVNKISTKNNMPTCQYKIDDIIFVCTVKDNVAYMFTVLRNDEKHKSSKQ
jgi:hypothetical protein